MSLPDLLILSTATFYAAYVLTSDAISGPFHVFALIREHLPLGGLTSCIYCASPWLAALLYVLWLTPARPLVEALAIAGAGLMLGSFSGAWR
jgi:hypothetical protein